MILNRDIFAEIFNEQAITEPVAICNHNMICIDGYYTCIICGTVDIHRHSFVESSTLPKITNHQLYYRKSYFREKLKLMVGVKQSLSHRYQLIINELKTQSFNSITELKKFIQ